MSANYDRHQEKGRPNRWRLGTAVAAGTLVAAVAALPARATPPPQNAPAGVSAAVTPSALLRHAGDNWPMYNGDYTGRRYSALKQITPANVHELAAQWVFHTNVSSRLEGTPVVVNGIMYITAANDCYAVDARTGLILWHYHRPVTEGLIDDASSHHNRGVALWHNRVYMETDNAHLLCLDARSGNLLWDVEYANTKTENYGATSAPLVVKDKVLVGTSGGDDGVRGFIAAFDATTGKQAWRFWTIPGPGEKGNESWPGDMYKRGGGTTWMPGTFDPELNTLYWGTGNPAPDFYGEGRPGDDLYTDSVIALDPDTGKLKWYFQFTPHDLSDYDSTETPVLVDTVYQGQPRKLLLEANRNGFMYVLDRTDGKFLDASEFTGNVNWAKGIDKNGRPIKTGIIPTQAGATICPSYGGATNWYSPSYNPNTNLFYFLGNNSCNIFMAEPQEYEYGVTFYATGTKRVPDVISTKWLIAYDVKTGKFAWRYPLVGFMGNAGVMTTAGGLVFFGDDSTALEAVDAVTGKPLWHFTTGQAMTASPMSYGLDGRQYVAIAAGGSVFTFALPAAAP